MKFDLVNDLFDDLDTPDLTGPAPVSYQIYEYLRTKIIEGLFPPGLALSENKLCTFFGVSRQPVREALLRLSVVNLVQVYAQRGSVVTTISVKFVEQAQFIREAVEVEAARRAAVTATPALLSKLEAEIDLQKTHLAHMDINRFYLSDEAFHHTMLDHGGVPGMWKSLEWVKPNLDRVRHLELKSANSFGELIEQHEGVYSAIRSGDPKAAEDTLRTHLRRVLQVLKDIVNARPEYFSVDNDHAKSNAI